METTKKILAIVSIICAVFTISAQTKQEKPWVKKKDNNGIAVYMREYDGSDIDEVKAQTIIKAPINKIKESILNVNFF